MVSYRVRSEVEAFGVELRGWTDGVIEDLRTKVKGVL